MNPSNDLYSVLGLPRDAGDEQIKKAYRRLAMEYHPDRNNSREAEARFKEINQAYEVLSDPNKRAHYDRFGRIPGNGESFGFDGFEFGGIGDIFEAFFGGAAGTTQRRSPRKGADVSVRVTISFEEAYAGVSREIEIARVELCTVCKGVGTRAGTNPEKCPECNGQGQVRRSQQSIFGRFVQTSTCNRCQGQGSVINDPCTHCHGNGREKVRRKISVSIPAGVDQENRMRLSHEGEAGYYGGSPGDLYVHFEIKPHKFFVRRQDEVIMALPLNFAQAALGCSLEIPTMEGKFNLKVPAGTQHGRIFRIRDKGFPHINARGRGDQLVVVRLLTPEKLDAHQRKLMEELMSSLPKTEDYARPDEELLNRVNQE